MFCRGEYIEEMTFIQSPGRHSASAGEEMPSLLLGTTLKMLKLTSQANGFYNMSPIWACGIISAYLYLCIFFCKASGKYRL